MLLQRVRNLVPRRFRTDKDVHTARQLHVAEQVAGGTDGEVQFLCDGGHCGATGAAEGAFTMRRGLVPDDGVCTAQPAKTHQRSTRKRREERAVMLAAHRAMTMDRHRKRTVYLVADSAAQAGSLRGHGSLRSIQRTSTIADATGGPAVRARQISALKVAVQSFPRSVVKGTHERYAGSDAATQPARAG